MADGLAYTKEMFSDDMLDFCHFLLRFILFLASYKIKNLLWFESNAVD